MALVAIVGTGCQKGDLLSNPNAASSSSTVPVSLILNHITYSMYVGGGVVDGRPGAVNETPWDLTFIWGQYHVSNYQYYRGSNFYNWSNSATEYDMLKYTNLMQQQAATQFGTAPNVYAALSYFFKAYSFIWLTQRVGDIPMAQAGDPNNLTPAYNTQHDVYKNCLAMLDTANTLMGSFNALATTNVNAKLDANGDIYGMTNMQWQKLINTYKLRILISLSKRAADNADLNIPSQFTTILSNPVKYPIMGSNADNMVFTYNTAYNPYTIFARGNAPYNNYSNICKTFLDITTANLDPRTFIAAIPAPAQITAGKNVGDFTAYVGADINQPLSTLFVNGSTPATSSYSYANYNRYYTSTAGANAEPYILVGYPELCFNIAEAINRGWATGSSATWYLNGINASLAVYGLTEGKTLNIGNYNGTATTGTVVISNANFLSNANVVYAGDNATGLKQILTQKYVAFFENSGWESFYNWRRTGVPAFAQGGAGIGTPSNAIPMRWMYPQDEANYNTTNYQAAITAQYGGTDDVTKIMWLLK